jgi:type II secretory pathway component PulF
MAILLIIILSGLPILYIYQLKSNAKLLLSRTNEDNLIDNNLGIVKAKKDHKKNHDNSVALYLPIVVERIVMAINAGHDVYSAVKKVVTYSDDYEIKFNSDPVTSHLRNVCNLTDNGLSFDNALKLEILNINSPQLKHVFLYLSIAHIEGGSLSEPLIELADSMQTYYQDTIEHQIAKLPIKATIPLVITFGGMVICFLTIPVIRLLNFIAKN